MTKSNRRNRISFLCIIAVILLTSAAVFIQYQKKNQSDEKNETTTKDSLPQAPYGIKISGITEDGIEVYWKNTEYADGYEIFRSYEKKGTYESIKDITGYTNESEKSHGTYKDTTFNSGYKAIYYRLKSYEYDENGNKIYSKFTKALTAKYREDIKLQITELYLPSNTSRTVAAYYGWGDAKNLVWKSDDTSVASVSQDGTVTGISAGTCTVSCYSEDLQKEYQCNVIVDRQASEPLDSYETRYQMTNPGYWENSNADVTNDAVIMMTGDMMCTAPQQRAGKTEDGDYNLNESFTYVKDILVQSDFAIGNLETLLSNSWPYMSEEAYVNNTPNCNAPARYLDALKYAGFDGVVMSNNHNCDGGVNGAIESVENVDNYQLARTGLFESENDVRTLLININGIKTGFLSYTPTDPGFNGKNSDWSQADQDTYLNIYEEEKAKADIKALRDAGAEYIILYIHWGMKNVFEIGEDQQQMAQELADAGADYIVGGHSHLLQKYDEITAADGRSVPCFYSLGDFHSSINQIAGNRDSVILRIRLTRDESGEVKLTQNAYIPCYTFTEYKNMSYVTMPLAPELNGGIKLKKYEKFHTRIQTEVGNGIEEYLPK